jgi:sugar O-acyltransferase (sialic acid O-acetyltransferase NeuD family)
MKPIMILGAGGHCRACIDVIECEARFSIVGVVLSFLDDAINLSGYPLIGMDKDLPNLLNRIPTAIVGVGQIRSAAIRKKLFLELRALGANLPIIQSPMSYVSRNGSIGDGGVVMHGSIVNAGASIGLNSIINTHALIEHDTRIGDHCHISTGAKINGGVEIGSETFIGSGSVIKEGVKIGSRVVVGAGQIILRDVPDDVIVRG